MEKSEKIYVAGHTGLVGSAIMRRLMNDGYLSIVNKAHWELDLTRQNEVEDFFGTERPQYVILAAARVGGIHANITYPARFIYDNIVIQTNVIHSAYQYGVKKLLYLGSACCYPRECTQPMKEEYLLSGYLEPTNEPYAVAKIAGMKMCQAYNMQYGMNFLCGVPTNIYGLNDNFDPQDSHVIPALIRRFHEAKMQGQAVVTIWGTGNPKREFIYVDDLADACYFLMQNYDGSEIINIGCGEDISIKELAYIIREVVRYNGDVNFDTMKPDGIPRKMLDVSKLKSLGWQAKISLEEGISKTYAWYLQYLEGVF